MHTHGSIVGGGFPVLPTLQLGHPGFPGASSLEEQTLAVSVLADFIRLEDGMGSLKTTAKIPILFIVRCAL